MKRDEAAILKIEEELAEAFNRREVDRSLSHFDARFIGFSSTTHERLEGLDALRETFEYYLRQAAQVEFHISDARVRIYGDAAIATFYWVVTLRDGERVRDVKGRGTHVFLKRRGKWRIVHEHFSRAHHRPAGGE